MERPTTIGEGDVCIGISRNDAKENQVVVPQDTDA